MENPLEQLTLLFERFPGIGPRQARRFVQHLLSQNVGYRAMLARNILALGKETQMCKKCFRWFVKHGRDSERCTICINPQRDPGIIFVLEKDTDIDNVERSGFKGLYFVLGGSVPLAEEHPEKFIRAKELLTRVDQDASAGLLKELILGLSATTEGDHTRLIVQEKLLPLKDQYGFKISALGRGLSTGSELEYADPETIANALSSRG
jgi:recombination protein RecR